MKFMRAPSSIYNICLKLKERDMDINRVYDLAAVKIIITRSENADCYEALGIVSQNTPMIGRLKTIFTSAMDISRFMQQIAVLTAKYSKSKYAPRENAQ